MSKYIIIPIIFTSTIVYGDNQKFNEYAIFCEKMIVTLQSCTDEKSTFSHSSEFPIILYTVLNENPLKDPYQQSPGHRNSKPEFPSLRNRLRKQCKSGPFFRK